MESATGGPNPGVLVHVLGRFGEGETGSLGFVAGVSFTLAVDVAEAARKNTNAARGRPSSASTMPMALGATKCSSTLSVRALPRIFSAGSAGFIFFFFLLRRGGCRASCRLSRWLLLLPAWW